MSYQGSLASRNELLIRCICWVLEAGLQFYNPDNRPYDRTKEDVLDRKLQSLETETIAYFIHQGNNPQLSRNIRTFRHLSEELRGCEDNCRGQQRCEGLYEEMKQTVDDLTNLAYLLNAEYIRTLPRVEANKIANILSDMIECLRTDRRGDIIIPIPRSVEDWVNNGLSDPSTDDPEKDPEDAPPDGGDPSPSDSQY